MKKFQLVLVIIFIITSISVISAVNLSAAPVNSENFIVDYKIQNNWGSGATVSVDITNKGSVVQDWTIKWTFSGNEKLTNMWNAEYTQSGSSVTVKNNAWNGTIPTSGSQSFGFNLSYSGDTSVPSNFTVTSSTSSNVTPVVTANATTADVTTQTTPEPSQTSPVVTNVTDESLVAFPGAEGYGKTATGGRGGKVYEVTTLNSSGSGSLGEALGASGARTVVFRVGGTIKGDFTISNDDITIAGQTAPGDGICINGSLKISADNVILRYIRVRANANDDTITNDHNNPGRNIIIDHVSASWSGDEVFSIYFNEDVTFQWCMITEACSSDHKFGGIWGNNRGTYHHNLFAHNTDRNPRIASGSGNNDLRNNVIYNWKNFGIYGGEVHEVGKPEHTGTSTNVVANYIKPGPGTPTAIEKHSQICSPWSRDGASDYGDWYVADNYVVGHPDVTADNWKGVFPQYTGSIDNDQAAIPGLKLDNPVEYMPIRQQTAEDAYIDVLKDVGCSLPNYDSVDSRIIEEVRNGTATYGSNGFISTPSEVGGHPSLKNGTAPTDSDHDGMPDSWENKNGLDPNNSNDRNNKDSKGYTMLENYLNSIDSL
ncbi:MAG: cellulose binding domain-containing protein [Clostridiales bacterium]